MLPVALVPNSACVEFAKSLSGRLFNGVVKSPSFEVGAASNWETVGFSMHHDAIENVDGSGKRYIKGQTPIDGFKADLTNNGQGADVYRHILFTAGNVLRGLWWGASANAVFIAYDWQQAQRGRKESETELRDDYAGLDVGNAMLRTAKAGGSGDYGALTSELTTILCK